MLVFGRKCGPDADAAGTSQIVIDLGERQIVVQVVRDSDNKLRIGVDAPRDLPVWRGEVWRRRQGE